MSCFICEKHLGSSDQPPGGYVYEDDHWMVCHFPAQQSVLGQMVVESKRHFLDFSAMTDEEATSYGLLVKSLYAAIRKVTGAERVYTLVTLEGIPHFHAHFIPRYSDSPAKGMNYITQNWSCDERDVIEIAGKLRAVLNS